MEVTLHGDTEPKEGYFSLVMYWRGDKSFKASKYFRGLRAYQEILNTRPYFSNVGLLIYTDEQSLPVLQEALPGSKTTFLSVSWPEYTYKGVLDGGILRCARFQATQQFPDAWIACRDADTLFPLATKNPEFVENLGAWEESFCTEWLARMQTNLVLGVNHYYQQEWHMNMLFPNLYRKINTKSSILRRTNITRRHLLNGTKETNPLFYAPLGIYAGFANFPPGLTFWSRCEAYLQQRFFILPEIGLSNKDSVIPSIGKDERLLLFVILPMFQDRVFYFTIVYEDEEPEPLSLRSNIPRRVFTETYEGLPKDFQEQYEEATQTAYKLIFGEFLKQYQIWSSVDPAIYEARYRNLVKQVHLNKTEANLFYPSRKRKNRRQTRKRKARK